MSQSPSWSIILHAGCSNSCPPVERQQEIKQALASVLDIAVEALKAGSTAKDVVIQTVAALEDCPLFNAGKGSALTVEGDYELEAGLVDGHSGSYGAVSCVTTIKNPILAANVLLEKGVHCMLVGNAADDMARTAGLEPVPNSYFETASRRAYWESTIGKNRQRPINFESGTVGAVALDIHGHIAAGGSSGGISGKSKGRVGDTAVLGAGLFADSELGIACSGAGDEIFRQLLATKIANEHARTLDMEKAMRCAISKFALTGKPGAVIALNNQGKVYMQSTARLFSIASTNSSHQSSVDLSPTTHLLLPQHIFFRGLQISAGLSLYPTTRGHSLVALEQVGGQLFSLDRAGFLAVMSSIKPLASVLCDFYKVSRCALLTEGNDNISIIPLHGLAESWEPVTSHEKDFQETYPGYISSKDGPDMAPERLVEITAMIRRETGLKEPLNHHFNGDVSDSNLFARLVRGELPHSRVWEDRGHVAFLTPFANTPGFTVLVPREHLTSNIFKIDDATFASLMDAAYTLAHHLMKAFGVPRCGMIFEGFEIDYAHVKLIPIRSHIHGEPLQSSHATAMTTYEKRYQGYVTSLGGPFLQDQEPLVLDASALRNISSNARSLPSHS